MENAIVIPWDWYIVRATALIGFLLLYVSILIGTASCLPGIRKYFLRLRSLNFHCWISLQALFFALAHAVALLFHQYIPFSSADIFIPFHSTYEPLLSGLGTIVLYLMVILVATSYARKYISTKLWRTVHFLNIGLYIAVIIHALYLGTDLKSGILCEIFIWSNGILILLLFFNMAHRIWLGAKNQPIICENPNNNENLPGRATLDKQKKIRVNKYI
jgi:methionine sulfoxide reductase heme-binding subunit